MGCSSRAGATPRSSGSMRPRCWPSPRSRTTRRRTGRRTAETAAGRSGGDACEPLVDEAHHRRSLAHRRGTPLGRAGTNVADRIDARNAGLELPGGSCVLPGEDEAVFVPGDDVADPVGAWIRAQKAEHRVKSKTCAVPQRHGLQLAPRAMELGHLTAVAHGDSVTVELGKQIVGHRLPPVAPPMK